MGKFQSKFASKRRQNPEGGSLASNALSCHKEPKQIHIHKTKLTENLYVELRENKSDHDPRVALPPEKAPDRGNSTHLRTKKRNGHVGVTECNVVRDEDTHQEWVFTLYNFDNSGKVTKEDMCSLIHSIYEVLEASVKQPDGGTKPLKIKLVVTPTADPEKTSQKAEKEPSVSQEPGTPERRLYCADENIERRNHYLDLAGIENFSSKFDDTESPSQEPRQDVPSALQHHHVAIGESCISPESTRGLPVPHSLKTQVLSVGKDRNGGEGKHFRLHGQHPASWYHPCQHAPQQTHSKRLRFRAQDSRPTPGGDREILSHLQPSCGALASTAKRHKHHHHHEHHHHHHHHYHPS